MPCATLHFLAGPTGAGKTTYARRFCNETGAVRFSVDEWMTALFWMDSPQPLEPAWSMERVERCSMQIWETAVQVARAGAPCMLELGFASRANRYRYAEMASKADLPIRLHVLDLAADDRWKRVQLRNQRLDGQSQLRFAVTRDLFNFAETFWEPPTPEEMAEFAGLQVSS